MVRELGLKRRETVWSLSTVHENLQITFTSVREDRGHYVNYLAIVLQVAKLHIKL